jgi:hypothetical protein
MENLQELINQNFPIGSQTSEKDKLFLLNAITTIKARAITNFKYIEIGSFLGGSLTACLLENKCSLIVSVDERERQQLDERGAKYDYSGITHQTMIDNLTSHGMDVSKLTTHDGSISSYDRGKNKFDLAFIDGEHSDIACCRDFAWTYPMMKESSIILFHDSSIIYRALAIILELMHEKKVEFQIFKDQMSEITAIFLGEFAQINHREIFGDPEDWASFQNRSEVGMLTSVIKNRVNFEVNPIIKPAPVLKAF